MNDAPANSHNTGRIDRHDHGNDYRHRASLGDHRTRGAALSPALAGKQRTPHRERPIAHRVVRIRASGSQSRRRYRTLDALTRRRLGRWLDALRRAAIAAFTPQISPATETAALMRNPLQAIRDSLHINRQPRPPIDFRRHEELQRRMVDVTRKLEKGDPLARMIRGNWRKQGQ